jgi:hypothetical protein
MVLRLGRSWYIPATARGASCGRFGLARADSVFPASVTVHLLRRRYILAPLPGFLPFAPSAPHVAKHMHAPAALMGSSRSTHRPGVAFEKVDRTSILARPAVLLRGAATPPSACGWSAGGEALALCCYQTMRGSWCYRRLRVPATVPAIPAPRIPCTRIPPSVSTRRRIMDDDGLRRYPHANTVLTCTISGFARSLVGCRRRRPITASGSGTFLRPPAPLQSRPPERGGSRVRPSLPSTGANVIRRLR